LGRAHTLVARGGRDVLLEGDEMHVGELVAHHLAGAVGRGVVDRNDLERGPVLLARGEQAPAQRVSPLVVEDRDGDGRAQFGTWPRIHGPSTLAAGMGSRFHARMSGANRLVGRSADGAPPAAVSMKIHGSV